MNVLYATSETTGFVKTGGLADVAAALPTALAQRGVAAAVIMPLYRGCRSVKEPLELLPTPLSVALGDKTVVGRLWKSRLPGTNVPVYLIENDDYFGRDDPALGRGIYQFTDATGAKADYPDNLERYVFFCRAIIAALPLLEARPSIINANDWQTGLLPLFLSQTESDDIRVVFTIHNLAYQGAFDVAQYHLLNLPWSYFSMDQLEFYNKINCLKAGVVFSDAITTVSPTYAKEMQTKYYGCGLQGVLFARKERLSGIVNGIDDRVWNPATDRFLPLRYDVETAAEGKAAAKLDLQRHFGLDEDPSLPLFGVVSRLAAQKGLDKLATIAPRIVALGGQLVVLGVGDPPLHEAFTRLRLENPSRIGVAFALDESLAHRIEAGSDCFLMPSQYEPCGLNQLYSLRYGAVPIVRETGGLADTVVDATPENLAAGRATGFSFVPLTEDDFMQAIERALELFRRPAEWAKLRDTGMRQDWSWRRSAAEYQKLYESLLSPLPPPRLLENPPDAARRGERGRG